METGEVIKKLRNQKKITQTELGVMLGVNTSSIQKYESGATRNLKLETIRELCHIFDVPPILFVFPEALESNNNEHFYNMISYHLREHIRLDGEEINKIMDYIHDMKTIHDVKVNLSQHKSR